MQKSSFTGNSLIWFGAAISIAEILTGTLLSPLGFWKAAAAIIIGHLIGCTLLFFAGWIGAKYNVTSMEGVKWSFGSKGGIIFSVLNLIQLVGWSSVMIAAGAQSAHGILDLAPWCWACIIGGMLLVWTMSGTKELKILNTLAISLLFVLAVILGFTIFPGKAAVTAAPGTALSFGDALELSIAMPLSWLPLIADYTRESSRPKMVSLLSAGVYFLTSCWMYFTGLCASLYAGTGDIAQILHKAGLGVPALLIIVVSTVTATFLDVYSSEMSVLSITKKIPRRAAGALVCVCGVLMAIFCNTAAFEQFLYWIGSVFAPMIAIQITDFFILKKADAGNSRFRLSSLILWAAGFVFYRILLAVNPVCGSTVPVMLFTAGLRIALSALQSRPKPREH